MGDTSKHLTYFKVENFKRFESFEMNDLGQFNLILGDNNVGKTSVLEALLFDQEDWIFVNNLFGAIRFRNLKLHYTHADLELYFNKGRVHNFVEKIQFKWTDSNSKDDSITLQFDKSQQELRFNKSIPSARRFSLYQSISFDKDCPFPYVPFFRGHDEDLTRFYSKLQRDKSLKTSFISGLKSILPTLENIELSSPYSDEKPHLILYQTHMNSTLPLAIFGDGTVKVFRLLAEIVINSGGRLMVDEIDAGIHYSRFKEFWRVILKAALDNKVQLFMTTHNEECIKYFKEALENDLPELKEKSRSITLIENPTSREVKAFTYTFDQLEANIDVGNEIRGGRR